MILTITFFIFRTLVGIKVEIWILKMYNLQYKKN